MVPLCHQQSGTVLVPRTLRVKTSGRRSDRATVWRLRNLTSVCFAPGADEDRVGLLREVSVEEVGHLGVGIEAVLEFSQAVPLVLVEKVLDRTAVLLHALHDLLCLSDRHPGVVLAVDHHERGPYSVRLVDGAYGLEEVAVVL